MRHSVFNSIWNFDDSLERSFPSHRSLMGDSPEAIEGQAKLFRVLIAYAKYNPKIGYSQGGKSDYKLILILFIQWVGIYTQKLYLRKSQWITAHVELQFKP